MSPADKKDFRFLPSSWIDTALGIADRVSRPLVRLGVSPNGLSVLGLLSGLAIGLFYALDDAVLAAAFIVICGILDILDGKVAANSGRRSLFGAMVDSSLDRYSEFLMLMGLAYHFRRGWGLWLTLLALLGSSMVSYTRARAEGLGVDCSVGPMQRAERLVLLFIATVAGIALRALDPALLAAVVAIAVASNLTAIQRIFHVRRTEKSRSPKEV